MNWAMKTPKIIAYLKPVCGWSNGVRAVLQKYNLPFEDRDIINNPEYRLEMMEKSGQPLSPCVEIDGVMLADVSGEEVEQYLLQNKIVEAVDVQTSVPTDRGCSDELHAQMNAQPIDFEKKP
jgi:glutaredoxin